MLSFLSFLFFALIAIVFLTVVVGLLLLSRGIDIVRRLFGLPPKSPFNWSGGMHTTAHRPQQQGTTRTSDGVTIIDRRSPDEAENRVGGEH